MSVPSVSKSSSSVLHSVFHIVACVCSVWLCVSRRPSVTLNADRRTHASRRGLWEGGVALRGCALLLSFPFFPPSRPSSPPVLRPSPPLTFRLQVFFFFTCTPLPNIFSFNLSLRVLLALFLCSSSWSSSCKCVFRRRLPRCTPLAAILALRA